MIEIKDLHKSYKMGSSELHVLKGINFNIEEGELVAIMGSSGSGKSTLLNILGILDEADSGSYILDKTPIKKLNETIASKYRNKFLGFVFQSFNLINYKTALDNVAMPLYYQGVKRKERYEIAMKYLEKWVWVHIHTIYRTSFPEVKNSVLQSREHWLQIQKFYWQMSLQEL
jgi:putative ABC transport system ATP-binding protein